MTAQPSDCKRFFGYLSERSKGVEIPEECVTCPKSLDCMLCEDKTPDARSVSHSQPHASLESLMVGTASPKQKVTLVPRANVKVPHRSLVDLATKAIWVCGGVVFHAYCWVAVKIVSLCSLTASGLQVATGLLKCQLPSRFSRSFGCFRLLGWALLQVKTTVMSLLEPLANFLSQRHVRMSMSLTRRVKPAPGVLHIEALGVAVNIRWTPQQA